VYHIRGWGKFNRHYGDFCTGADISTEKHISDFHSRRVLANESPLGERTDIPFMKQELPCLHSGDCFFMPIHHRIYEIEYLKNDPFPNSVEHEFR
jgi:hypothetical protein